MIDLRSWRATLLCVPLALVIAMFSLDDVPRPLQPGIPPDAFDAEAAATLAEDLAESYPEPRPGSDQDVEIADLIEARFAEIPAVEVSEQRFDASFGGEDVELRNLIAVLPGQSERQVALIAHRDTANGSGAASSLAATAALLELASGYAGSTHEKTLVFVSTDGGGIGALGARRFVRDYSEAGLLEAAVVLSQPVSPEPAPPMVVPWSTGDESTSALLDQTATSIVSEQVAEPAGDEGPLDDLFRLALPAALGEQGPFIEAGVDAVRLSSAGERPLPPDRDRLEEIDAETLERFGRASLSLLLALDAAESPLEHGPDAYIGLAGNLLPGWTLSLLALTLLLPVAVAAGAGLATAARSPAEAALALGWAALRAVPFLIGLLFLYSFSLVGLIPDPEFPFDPAAEGLGLGGTIAVVVALLAFAAAAFLLRPLLPPPAATSATAAAGALALAALAGFGVWFVNPYLALLVAVGLQAWVLAAGGVVEGRLRSAGLVAIGMLPALLLTVDLAGRFDAGPGVLADLVLMFSDDQFSDRLAVLSCLLGGAALAIVAARGPAPPPGTPQLKLDALVARGQALEERRAARRERTVRGKRGGRRRRGGRRERPLREAAPEQGPRSSPAEEPLGEAESAGDPAEPELPADQATPDAAEDQPDLDQPDLDRPDQDQPGDDQGEPARDPRMWSKPGASTARPWPSLITASSPAVTSPI